MRPHVVLVDLLFANEKRDGIWVLREIHRRTTEDQVPEDQLPRCIIHSNFTWNSPKWDWLGEAFRERMWGYVHKGASIEALIEVIRTVAEAKECFNGIPEEALTKVRRRIQERAGPEDLTARQIEACRWKLKGLSSKEIAKPMGLTERRAHALLQCACKTLGCRTIEDLVAHLTRTRLLDHIEGNDTGE